MTKKRTFIEEARRKDITEIAIRLMVKHGYPHTSLDMIAQEAGVTKGVIYYHFGGKDELVGEVWESLLDKLYKYRLSRVEAATSAIDKLKSYVEANFDFLLNRPQKKYFNVIFEAGVELNGREGRNPWSAKTNARCFKIIGDIIRQGREEGVFGPVAPEHLAPVLQGAIDGIVLTAYSDAENVDWRQCRDALLDMLFAYLGVGKG
ncbi:MAG: TetR/AcrR family transcriptional regulator [Pseudomonadota bacterium]